MPFNPYLFQPDDESDDREYSAEKVFAEYRENCVEWSDESGCDCQYYGPVREGKPHGFGINIVENGMIV